VAQELHDRGATAVAALRGGLAAWQRAGHLRPLRRKANLTEMKG